LDLENMRTYPLWLILSPLLLGLFGIVTACEPSLQTPAEGDEPGQCSDGEDNDGDGTVDCQDADCAGDLDCAGDDDDDTGDDDDDDLTVDECTEICINEFQASNASTITDASGAYPDWIELYNVTDADIDLDGYSITDDFGDPAKVVLAGGLVLPAGGWLLLWADGDTDQGDDHLSFRLDRSGEEIAIFDPDGEPLDALEYTYQLTDDSEVRVPDGGQDWETTSSPTPGETNGD